ncbi:MAG TPA: DUF3685 domain-containing protein [Leptolyngbyaceae cyanobacterium M33_DOE_097]|uniref:DUF3685 domain-containing protein n=1 Tax=Oscillatoriales cyanobacterium SpSt-418 TaxID=2282169 RepID=A0A7C3PIQ0_9CYAN|nr:DUF3685 domain-containing protein [Leptolyngbyaceae cyanobacterium M33_DOE_097]
MNRSGVSGSEISLIRLVLIEDDPFFRMGLAAHLQQFDDLRLLREVDSAVIALGAIREVIEAAETEPVVVLLSLDLLGSGESGLALCRQIRGAFPTLPMVLLSRRTEPAFLATAYQTGATGYCDKQRAIANLVPAIRQVAAGYPYWTEGMQAITNPVLRRPAPSNPIPPNQTALAVLRRNLRLSGVQQIDAAIAEIDAQLRYPQLSLLDELVLTGRRRELFAARWLLHRLLANPRETQIPYESVASSAERAAVTEPVASMGDRAMPPTSPPPTRPTATSPSAEGAMVRSAAPIEPVATAAMRSIQASLFDSTSSKLQARLYNLTDAPLEIDILRDDKKRELLYIILRRFETVLDELRFSQISSEAVETRRSEILHDLWQQSLIDFLGRYSTFPTQDGEVAVVDRLLNDGDRIQTAILEPIPFVVELVQHLVFQAPLTIDDAVFAPGSVEAMTRAEMILHHLMVQIANAVIQPLLNRFGNIELVKQTFFDKRLLSTREVERFRNNLSWRYRTEKYLTEPTAIFESRQNLYTLTEAGIARNSVYAPRNGELEKLTGIPLVVTLVLEGRDAIAPRVRAAVAFIGSGVVYVLTEVIGRGIGLVGRGVIKGIGNSLQDARFNRMNRDGGRWR